MAVSKFVEEKWRKGFHFLDLNKDGLITVDDLENFAAYICDRTGASEDERANVTKQWVKWYWFLNPSSSNLTEEKFISELAEQQKNPQKHVADSVATYSATFDNLDLDKDGRISYEELKIYYEGHGVKDEVFIRRVFDQLDTNKNGYIEREEMIRAGVNFWTSSDETDGYSFIYDLAN